MAQTFKAQIDKFANLTAQNIKYVAVESIQDVMEAAQTPQPSVKRTGGSYEKGKIPVDTSALINSLTSGSGQGSGAPGADSYVVALAGYQLGEYMRFAWTAAYALLVEVGTSRMAGRHFVGMNAARFSEFVAKRVAEVKR